eukprot:TRINITY_DN22410_c0_g1_i1.p1 TRINITY_DN22410_c0_g1~~TRINITY_DN22410_c0_g1_i1.p1  ORF type:complete len:690 (+),score=279.43 TRINITY_DN22410_c0_g1_i1:36-2105(+)
MSAAGTSADADPNGASLSQSQVERAEEDDHAARAAKMEELTAQAAALDDQKKKLTKTTRQADEAAASLAKRDAAVAGLAKVEQDQMCRKEQLQARSYKLTLAGPLEELEAQLIEGEQEVAKAKEALSKQLAALTENAKHFAMENEAFNAAQAARLGEVTSKAAKLEAEEGDVRQALQDVKGWLAKMRGELAEHKEVETHRLAVALHSAHRFHEENVVLTEEEKELKGKEAESAIKLDRQRKQIRHLKDLNAHISGENANYAAWDRLVDASRQATICELGQLRVLRLRNQQIMRRLAEDQGEEDGRAQEANDATVRLEQKEKETAALREEAAALRAEVDRVQEQLRVRTAAVQTRTRRLEARREHAAAQHSSLERLREALTRRDDELTRRQAKLKATQDSVTQWRHVLHHRERLLARAEQGEKIPSLWKHPMPLQDAPSRVDSLQHQHVVNLRQARADTSKPGIQKSIKNAIARDNGRLSGKDLTPTPAVTGPVHAEDHLGVFVKSTAGKAVAAGVDRGVLRATAKVSFDASLAKLSARFTDCLQVLAQHEGRSFLSEEEAEGVQRAALREAELVDEGHVLALLEQCPLNGGSTMHTNNLQLLESMRAWWRACCDARDRLRSGAARQRQQYLSTALALVARRAPELFDGHAVTHPVPTREDAADALLAALQPVQAGPPRVQKRTSPLKAR